MQYNLRLYGAIKEKGLTQSEFARIVNDDPSRVSRIINGVWNPDETRKVRYAKALGVKVEEIFPNE